MTSFYPLFVFFSLRFSSGGDDRETSQDKHIRFIREEINKKCRRVYQAFLSCYGKLPWNKKEEGKIERRRRKRALFRLDEHDEEIWRLQRRGRRRRSCCCSYPQLYSIKHIIIIHISVTIVIFNHSPRYKAPHRRLTPYAYIHIAVRSLFTCKSSESRVCVSLLTRKKPWYKYRNSVIRNMVFMLHNVTYTFLLPVCFARRERGHRDK